MTTGATVAVAVVREYSCEVRVLIETDVETGPDVVYRIVEDRRAVAQGATDETLTRWKDTS